MEILTINQEEERRMPMCGFNENMLDGLKGFHKGLVEHGIIDRSKLKNKTANEIIENEIRDMDRFLKEAKNIKDPEIREIIENLTKYARSFYSLISKIGLDKYQEIISSLNKIYFDMDRKYYKELEGKNNDMKKLVEHLNKVKIGG